MADGAKARTATLNRSTLHHHRLIRRVETREALPQTTRKPELFCALSTFTRPGKLLYCNPSTLSASSANPLGETKPQRNVLCTGWEPRGDNGPARGRLRATQPASSHPAKR